MDIDTTLNWHNVLSALVFSGIGLVVYTLGFVLLTLLTPQVHIWREINEEKNVAIAIFLGCIALGIAIIISAAVRG
jgi:putative membrane protein